MQIRSAGLVLLVSLWCSSAMAQPDIRVSPGLGVLTSAQKMRLLQLRR